MRQPGTHKSEALIFNNQHQFDFSFDSHRLAWRRSATLFLRSLRFSCIPLCFDTEIKGIPSCSISSTLARSFVPTASWVLQMAHLSAASAPQLSSSHALNGDIKLEKKAQLGVHSNDLDSLNVCASPGSGSIPARRSRKGKEESLLSSLRSWIVQHQIGTASSRLHQISLKV